MLARAARLVIAALVLTLPLAPVVHADQDIVGAKYTAKVSLPISTTVFHQGTMENVQVTGTLLVKTFFKYPGGPVKIVHSYKLGKDTTAIGMTSGDSYGVTGKNGIKHLWPPSPVKGLDQVGVINLVPINPIYPNDPIRVHYHVDFDNDGAVSGSLIDFPANPVTNTCTAIATICN